ncbi:SRPBCC family protein [Sphingomonas bacterium]|uniref:SRPBCC family protein n=1 Tax=Sphingomonas bacterium TaxID=1895847 RepID=UPI0015775458|nr:SRPBCC family protein [Sphingomonas bacterium]
MTDTHDSDDAPVATAKSGDPAGEASSAIADAKGDTIIGRAVTINRPVEEVYSYFRDFSNLPSFMENVVSIDVKDARLSHWMVKAPGGKTVEWDARVTADEPNRLIAWTSEEGADVPNSGTVTFDPVEGRGTVVTATILYDPPGGVVGKLIAKMFQKEPAIQARRDLNRFKQLMEAGEVATPAMNPRQHEEMGL